MRAAETATPIFEQSLPNVPGKKIVAVRVDYPPGAKSTPHTHAPSAFIFAYVLAGQIRSQVGDGPVRIYKTGEKFYEAPGSQHRVSENASDTNPASLLAVFIVDDGDTPLTTPMK
ncbi:cupin domain-containing protein [Mesorhizobium sp. CU2]|uniref:cupin domain-containing protein n=1 Tax=unclassified Mesorhizobium TaxID=325217 RepID=UPI00387EDACC